jgi:hypothetical protein
LTVASVDVLHVEHRRQANIRVGLAPRIRNGWKRRCGVRRGEEVSHVKHPASLFEVPALALISVHDGANPSAKRGVRLKAFLLPPECETLLGEVDLLLNLAK